MCCVRSSSDDVYMDSTRSSCSSTSLSMALSGITTIALLILTALTLVGVLPHSAYLLPVFATCLLTSAIVFFVCFKLRQTFKELEEFSERGDAANNEQIITGLQEAKATIEATQKLIAQPLINTDAAMELNNELLEFFQKMVALKNKRTEMSKEDFEAKINKYVERLNRYIERANLIHDENLTAWSLTGLKDNIKLATETFSTFVSNYQDSIS